MKKHTMKIGMAISAAVLAFVACKKEKPSTPTEALNTVHASNARLHSDLANANDAADERMNDNLYMLANGFASFATNSSMMDVVYTKAASNEGDVDYSTLVTTDSNFKTYMNDYLYTNYFSNERSGFDGLAAIEADMTYANRQYKAGVTVINISTCDKSLLPIVCTGAEVNNDDAVIAYTINSDGSKTESKLTEANAMASSRPVIIINNAPTSVETDTNYEQTGPSSPTATTPDSANCWLRFGSYQIKAGYSFENPNSNSELKSLSSLGDVNQQWLNVGAYGQDEIAKLDIATISQTDVASSHVFTNSHPLFVNAISIIEQHDGYDRIYETIYEHDWYARKKPVSVCYYNLVHKPKMKYQTDWYVNLICGFQYLAYFPTPSLVGSYPIGWNNWKFSCTIGRDTLH